MPNDLTIVEVGPRDGFQPIGPFIPTADKISYVRRLYEAGLRRIEITAFVSDRAVPQLSDAVAVLEAALLLPDLAAQVLVPNRRYCTRALDAGARDLAFVLSASEKHNMNNVRRTVAESVAEFAELATDLPSETAVRLNVATAFDCPFDGAVDPETVMTILDRLVATRPAMEIALCDTTGRATPDRVRALFARVTARFSDAATWVFHGHDTYGLGVANVLAAHEAGVRTFDASVAGLGGCPFAPGATGNVATEDVVWTFLQMGLSSGIDLDRLLDVATDAACIPGGQPGGRVRTALLSKPCVDVMP